MKNSGENIKAEDMERIKTALEAHIKQLHSKVMTAMCCEEYTHRLNDCIKDRDEYTEMYKRLFKEEVRLGL